MTSQLGAAQLGRAQLGDGSSAGAVATVCTYTGRFSATLSVLPAGRPRCVGQFTATLTGPFGNGVEYVGRFTSRLDTASPLRTPLVCDGIFYALIDLSGITHSGDPACIGRFTATIVLPANAARESCLTGNGATPPPAGGGGAIRMW